MSGSDNKFPVSIVIGAVDRVTGQIRDINSKIAKLTSPIKSVGKSFKDLGEATGLGNISDHFKGIIEKAGKFKDGLVDIGLKLGAFVGVGSFGLYELIRGFGETSEAVSHAAQRLGITTDKYQELAGAAKLAGVPMEEFDGIITKFSKNIGEAALGTGAAHDAFYSLQVDVKDAHDRVKSFDTLLPQVADKLSKIKNYPSNK